MEEAPAQEAVRGRRFLIPVKRPWKLWVFILGLALVYLVWVLLVATRTVGSGPITDQDWVLGGLGLFALLIFLELLLLIPRRAKKAKAGEAADDGEAWTPDETIYAPPAAGEVAAYPEPEPSRDTAWGEYLLTSEELKGRSVLEVSMPPKSRNKGGVYSKAYVDIGSGYVIRIEDLVAGPEESVQYA